MIDYVTLIIGVITTISAGGWFVNYRAKKKIEESNVMRGEAEADKIKIENDNSKVDLVEKILDKYNQQVLSSMENNSAKHDQQHEQILTELSLVSEFLNGDYVEFKKKK